MLFDIAPPLSCTTNHPPFGLFFKAGIYITVPIGYPFPAATVYQDFTFAPDAVIPYPLSVGFLSHVEAVYADVFNVFTIGVIPSTFLAKAELLAAASATDVEPYLSALLLEVTSVI